MGTQRWLRIKEIVADALELEPHAREAHVKALLEDPAVISEALRLIRLAEPGGEGLLDSPSWKPGAFLSKRFGTAVVPRRFEVLREAGRGGMGVVFECFDQHRRLRVALKTLNRLSPLRLYSFKQEFRGLAGVTHANLVSLYELLQEGKHYFLSMEFIDGTEFLEFVGEPGSARRVERLRAVIPQI